ncbi:alcohol dehydrogenase catalytic domain-containing protein [Streptomyces sp. NPDC048611]|uniref:alcohol dehydrogenase catalytic domain-containing protein n=1 Tax=Streptomyces sp. NPDC048611 TaxID=3155635 RepID=UPI0034443FE4
MRAVVHEGAKGTDGLRLTETAEPVPGSGEVRVGLRAAGLNHRDLFLMDSRRGDEPAFIPGSDSVGVVAAVGDGVSGIRVGDEVVINPSLG